MRITLLLFLALTYSISAVAEDWSGWRGPTGQGISEETDLPTKWSAKDHIQWKVPLSEPGNSTPIVIGDRIFLTTTENDGKTRSLKCLTRESGEVVWTRGVDYTAKSPTHQTNPYCSSSPVSDGERVVVWHSSAGLHSYRLDGEPEWSLDLGEFRHVWGYASSPVIYDNLVIVSCGPGLEAFVVAVDKNNGKEVWRFQKDEFVSTKLGEFRGSWSTPVIYEDNGRDVVLLSLPLGLYALDPKSGAEIWSCKGLSKLVYTSPITSPEFVVSMSGYHGPAIGVKSGGRGDVTETHRAWHVTARKQLPQRVGSGVIVGDHIYMLNEPGIASCLKLATGEKVWEKRIGGKSWSSVVHADGKLYIIDMGGTTHVLEPSPEKCKVIASNKLDELTRASIAISDGQLFIRTYQHLYCIGD